MIRQHIAKLIWGVVFLSLTSLACADILLIEKVRERMLRDLPVNGLTMDEVEARYGEPLDRRGPVGDPPITRWDYEDYSVYFEYRIVIESVLDPEAVMRELDDGPN
ncbi:hypothetical protein [Wenzhouxiangella marina]|uniref:Uncharacterized protein n=1 Tax=Wenzhouxiangella marina TaxID=1579979 RepID=A0A0K0XWA2_9GAMM|nr:hypothetical protein [Wenzhouxiangella marina]AKS41907.1 hypothetical protein WM2015_1537 [Wenzhouxiangella marina]MBB6086326.1 hypothetical protein [Wenzhouxiangella marina]